MPTKRANNEGTYYTETDTRSGKKKKRYCWKLQSGERGNVKPIVVKRSTVEERTKEVRKRLKELEESGAVVPKGKPLTIKQHCNQWLENRVKPPRRTEATYASYSYYLERFIYPAVGDVIAAKADHTTLQKVYDYAVAQDNQIGRQRGRDDEGKVSEGTALSAVRVACNALNISVKAARKAGLDVPNEPDPRQRILEEDEIEKFLKALFFEKPVAKYPGKMQPKYRDRFLIAFILNTGLRVSESLGVVVPMLSFRNETLTVNIQLRRYLDEKDNPQWKLDKTKSKQQRILPLNEEAISLARAQLAMVQADKEKLGDQYEDHGLLFATASGKPHNRRNVYRTVESALEDAGLEPCSIHDLRRTYLTYLADREGNEKVAQTMAGHASAATTQRIYIVARARRLAEAAGKVSFKRNQA